MAARTFSRLFGVARNVAASSARSFSTAPPNAPQAAKSKLFPFLFGATTVTSIVGGFAYFGMLHMPRTYS
jgi:hypothetical protein